jgi:enamine deaminase RidA (YjgF/YER057c/UK114 family)
VRKVIPGEQARSGRALSGAVVANGFVFVSGQTYAQGADIEEQTTTRFVTGGTLRTPRTSQSIRLLVPS